MLSVKLLYLDGILCVYFSSSYLLGFCFLDAYLSAEEVTYG